MAGSAQSGSEPDGGAARLERASAAIAPLARAPKLLVELLDDIRSIAEATRAIPELAERLAAIERRVGSLDDEVMRMRRSVDSIGEEVVGLRRTVEPLQGTLARVGRFAGRRSRRRQREDD